MGKINSIIKDGGLEKFDEADLPGVYVEYIVPDNVSEIGALSFNGCQHLYRVVIPDTVDTIKVAAFANCKNLLKVRLPERCIIEDYAFAGCENLQVVIMPKIAEIGKDAFKGCPFQYNNSFSALNKIETEESKDTLADQLMKRNLRKSNINIGIVSSPVSQKRILDIYYEELDNDKNL